MSIQTIISIFTDIRVDWEIYNLVPDDRKLLDLMITYGNPFPIRDEQGVEVVPNDDDDPDNFRSRPSTRNRSGRSAAKDKFCDSPTTSMAASSEKESLLSKITQDLEREHERELEDVAEVAKEDRVIVVRIKDHEGLLAQCPFTLSANQMVCVIKGVILPDFNFRNLFVKINLFYLFSAYL